MSAAAGPSPFTPLSSAGVPGTRSSRPVTREDGFRKIRRWWGGPLALIAARSTGLVIDNEPSRAKPAGGALEQPRAELGLPKRCARLTRSRRCSAPSGAVSSFRSRPHRGRLPAGRRDAGRHEAVPDDRGRKSHLQCGTATRTEALAAVVHAALMFALLPSSLGRRSQAKLARSGPARSPA